MKRLNIFPFVAITLMFISCASQNQKEEKPLITVDRSYLDKFELCEDVARWFESDEEMYDIMDKNTAGSAILAWNQLKDLCNQNKLYEAKDLLTVKHNEGHLIVFLRNTTAQYVYFNSIKYRVLQQVDSLLARKELVADLGFCMAMTECVVDLKDPEDTYVPPHYENLIYDYFMLLLEDGDYDKAEPLPGKLYKYSILAGVEESVATYHKLIMEAKYAANARSNKDALKKINELHTFMKADPDLADAADSMRETFMAGLLLRN